MKTKTKIITFSSALILAALLTVGFVKIVQYMCRYGLNYTETVKVDYEKGEQWIIKNSEKVETTSFDGLKLKACFVKNSINSHKYGIFIHAYTSHSSSPQLVRLGGPFTQGIYFFVILMYHLLVSLISFNCYTFITIKT